TLAFPFAGAAGILDDRASPGTGRAGRLDADNAGRLDHPAMAATVAARLAPASLGRPTSLAVVAGFVALELDLLGAPRGRLVEREGDVAADVATASAAGSSPSTEEVSKDVAEGR